ncbi:hypothetical protein, partial [Bradyrhizobium denitrificans]
PLLPAEGIRQRKTLAKNGPVFRPQIIPELMTRSNATEISKHQLPDLSAPFFRMPLMRRDLSRQHQKLVELEKEFPGTVLYASPGMKNLSQFNLGYKACRVHELTAFFSPAEIGLLADNAEHAVAYQMDPPLAYFCSTPRAINAMTFEALTRNARELFLRPRYMRLENSSHELLNAVRQMVSPEMRGAEGEVRRRIGIRRSDRRREQPASQRTERAIEDILLAREMVRVDLGLDVLIAQPRE